MADPQVEAVLALLPTDRFEELVALLGALDDTQRKKIAAQALTPRAGLKRNDDRRATMLTALACAPGLRRMVSLLQGEHATPDVVPLAVRVLTARNPPWLRELPADLLVRHWAPRRHFRLVRALVRDGAVEPPDVDEYALAMVSGLEEDFPDTTVLEQLRLDRGLLDREVWALLGSERAGRALTQHDDWYLKPPYYGKGEPPPSRPERTWSYALTTLAAEGSLNRDRLLDATLGAFFRDWPAVDVAWFVGLHDALAPTPGELEARQDRYGRLLAAEHGPLVKLGLRSLTTLCRGGHLDADLLLAAAPAALSRRDKGSVVAALGLLRDVAAGGATVADRVAEVAATALQHERVDVQESALALLTTLVPDDARRVRLLDRFGDRLAPSIRPAPVAVGEQTGVVETVTDEPLLPARDADEVAELFTRLIEEADDPAEVERLLDGVLRFAADRPRDGADVLAGRAAALLASYFPGAWSGDEPRADLCLLALVWLRGVPPGRGFVGHDYGWLSPFQPVRTLVSSPRVGPGSSLGELVTRRLHEVAWAVRTGGRTLLSLPTMRTGSLSAEELTRRVDAMDSRAAVLPIDACVALLRVPPEERAELRLPTSSRTGRFLRDQLRALERRRPEWQLMIDHAERAKRDPRHAARPTRAAWRDAARLQGADAVLQALLDRSDPLGTFSSEVAYGEYAARFDQVTAQWPQLLPHDPDQLAAHAHPRLYRGLIQNRSGSEPLLEFFGRTTRPLGPPALSALLLGLSAKNGSERARAVDALIDLARRSTLDGAGLGRTLAQLLAADAVIGTRVAQSMGDAARAEPRAGDALLDCLVTALAAFQGRRDAHAFIDLMAQLATERSRGVTLPEAFAAAAASTSKSQLAQACRRVPRPR